MNGLVNNFRKKIPGALMGPAAEPMQYFVAFGLGREAFAVGIRHVREILQFTGLTEVPLMPAFVRGVINLRGAVVPVLDLALRFGRTPTEVGRRTCVVILEVPQGDGVLAFGVIVDSVTEVLELAASEIEPPPSLGTGPRSPFIGGIAKVRSTFVILLDVARLLVAGEASLLAGAARPEPGEA